MVKILPANAGEIGSIPGPGRSRGEEIGYPPQYSWASLGGSDGKESACSVGDLGSIPRLGRFPWKRELLPTPVFLPGKSPWTEEPSGLQSMGLQRGGHD